MCSIRSRETKNRSLYLPRYLPRYRGLNEFEANSKVQFRRAMVDLEAKNLAIIPR